ncbi:hypothetical protein BDV33DRAFT_208625 [Aspergillus novoparasiticus]|uniref:C3H1-type domain-containing protein n=1 Tax=Aspergillus novoparasiticus TaxID=986946 RepID=A0A5N6EE72_9EURO|nr:hypothetical protein BDV33DRAFT_208625 [Aspergillus novoparasiticus]
MDMHHHRVEVDISDGEEYILEIVTRRRRAHPSRPQTAPQPATSPASAVIPDRRPHLPQPPTARPPPASPGSNVRPIRRAPLSQPQTTRPPPASPVPAVIPDRRATPIRPQTAPQPPVSSTTEPTISESASVVPSEYDGDLLRQVCPGHLIGQPCLQGHNCDRRYICEYIQDYQCEGRTCRYLHGIPPSCEKMLCRTRCIGCDRAHDYEDDRRANAVELWRHCGD